MVSFKCLLKRVSNEQISFIILELFACFITYLLGRVQTHSRHFCRPLYICKFLTFPYTLRAVLPPLISDGKFCDCCGVGRSRVTYVQTCVSASIRDGQLELQYGPAFLASRLGKDYEREGYQGEASFHVCTAAILQLASASVCSTLYMWDQQGRCTERNRESLEVEGKSSGTLNSFIVGVVPVCKTTAVHMGRLD